jgi:hypothetical protein
VWEPVHAQSPCAEESPVDRTPVVPAVVNGAKQSQQVWDTDHERTRLNVGTIITSPKGPVYSLVQIEEGRQLLIKAGSRPLNSEEGNYAVVQLELLAVWWATNECHVYLVGMEFTIVTGSRPLLGILSHAGIQCPGRNVRGYKCKIGWVLGKVRVMADTVTGTPAFEKPRNRDAVWPYWTDVDVRSL